MIIEQFKCKDCGHLGEDHHLLAKRCLINNCDCPCFERYDDSDYTELEIEGTKYIEEVEDD